MFSFNFFTWKRHESIISSLSSYHLIGRQTAFFYPWNNQPVKEMVNSEFKLTVLCLKIISIKAWPIVSLQWQVGLDKYTHIIIIIFMSCCCYGLNTADRTPTSAKRTPSLLARTMMRFGHTVWMRITVIFRWLYFYFINRHHLYRWVAVVSWLNYVILAVNLWSFSVHYQMKLAIDPTLGSSALLHIHHAASHGFWGLSCG